MSQLPLYATAPNPNTFADGTQFQDFVCMALAKEHIILQNTCSKLYQIKCGENLQGFEIKLDNRCLETGQLSIEIAEKSNKNNPNWVPSGIFRNDNSWLYIQGNYKILYVFGVKTLRRYFHGMSPPVFESYGTVRKFYLKLETADAISVKTIKVNP